LPDLLKLYFDGGCRPNPGPIETAVVVRGVTHFRGGVACGDNNEAEWRALLLAVELARAMDARDVLFVGDSAVVVRQASSEAKCRSPRLKPHLDAFRAASAGIERVRIRLVPRAKNLAGIALMRRRNFSQGCG
jgi:ribonuclease HI